MFQRCSRSVSVDEDEEYEFNRFSDWMLTCSKQILARVELVKLSEILENAYFPECSEFGDFFHAHDPHSIPK